MFAMTARSSFGRCLSWLPVVALACLIFGGVGCGGEETPPPGENIGPKQPPQDPDQPLTDTYKLQVVGNTSVALEQGKQLTLQVLYTKNGQAFGGQTVYFAPKGAYADSRLSIYQVTTDAYGFAETVLVAGKMITSFTIEASAEKDGPVAWAVSVYQTPTPPPPPTPTLEGNYTVTSDFNIKTDFSGSNLAQVLNILDKMSDDPQDPGQFVVDTVLSKVDNQVVSALAAVVKPTLYQQVNQLLASVAPQLVADLMKLSQDVSTIARHFELTSVMSSPTAQLADKPMLVDHKLTKIAWTLNGVRDEYAFSKPAVAEDVVLTLGADGDMTVAEHSFKIQYGMFLLAAINNLVLPQIDSNAYDIESLLTSRINCGKVATTMNNTVGAGGEALWKMACDTGLKAVALLIEDEIAKLDNGDSVLTLSGTGKLRDMDNDAKLDSLNNGVWIGDIAIDKCIAPLAGAGNTFWGKLSTATP